MKFPRLSFSSALFFAAKSSHWKAARQGESVQKGRQFEVPAGSTCDTCCARADTCNLNVWHCRVLQGPPESEVSGRTASR